MFEPIKLSNVIEMEKKKAPEIRFQKCFFSNVYELTDVPGATLDTMIGIFWSAPPWK